MRRGTMSNYTSASAASSYLAAFSFFSEDVESGQIIEEIFTQTNNRMRREPAQSSNEKMGFDGMIVDGIIACC